MEHIRQFDWCDSEPELNFLNLEDFEHSVTEKILRDKFRDPLLSSDSDDEHSPIDWEKIFTAKFRNSHTSSDSDDEQSPINWEKIFTEKQNENKICRSNSLPSLHQVLQYPNEYVLNQQQQCMKVHSCQNPHIFELELISQTTKHKICRSNSSPGLHQVLQYSKEPVLNHQQHYQCIEVHSCQNPHILELDFIPQTTKDKYKVFEEMLSVISDRLEHRVFDYELEVAWATLKNFTDETPENCQRFLENRGMEYFLTCVKCFPDKEELLRDMMGLLGNVAEVPQLRPQLMDKLFLSIIYELLEYSSDGVEVSYNAAGVLAHMASDGPDAWTVDEPARDAVLERVDAAVERWNLVVERNINYRSFEPILGLLTAHHTPQCQHWAVWALANLTTVYPEKYCSLVEAEGGLTRLYGLVNPACTYTRIKELAWKVIDNCYRFAHGSDDSLSRSSDD